MSRKKVHAQLSWAWKKFYNLGARIRPLDGKIINEFCNAGLINQRTGELRFITIQLLLSMSNEICMLKSFV